MAFYKDVTHPFRVGYFCGQDMTEAHGKRTCAEMERIMVRVIMHGCNGKMGQVISGLLANDTEAELAAGVDARDDGHNPYPVFKSLAECTVAADCIIDFSAAPAVDALLDYCEEKKVPCVLCTTGLSEKQLEREKKVSEKTAILKSATSVLLRWSVLRQ